MWTLLLAACGDRSPAATAPPTACLDPVLAAFAEEPVDEDPLARRFRVEVGEPASLELTCSWPGDPREVHRVTAAEAEVHEVLLRGLLAERSYTCTAVATTGCGSAEATLDFATGSLPPEVPPIRLVAGGEEATLDYLVVDRLQPGLPPMLLLLDPEGRVRWFREAPGEAPDGIAAREVAGGLLAAPWGDALAWVGLDGTVGATLLEGGVRPLLRPGGAGWLAAWEEADAFEVLEVPSDLGGFGWRWSSASGVEEGELPPEGPYGLADARWVDDAEGAGVELLLDGLVHRVDREDGQVRWQVGASGDFLLLDEEGAPAPGTAWFLDPAAILSDWPVVAAFDRGAGDTGTRLQAIALDEATRTATVAWSWTEEGWREPRWGDLDRLEDGTLLVVRSHDADAAGADPLARGEVLVLDPASWTVTWRVAFDEPAATPTHAARVDGCAVFASTWTCPEAGRRQAERASAASSSRRRRITSASSRSSASGLKGLAR